MFHQTKLLDYVYDYSLRIRQFVAHTVYLSLRFETIFAFQKYFVISPFLFLAIPIELGIFHGEFELSKINLTRE